jgi:hypothetical protein
MATETTASASLPPTPDPSKVTPPPYPKEPPPPVPDSSLPKELQGTNASQGTTSASAAASHYFGVWTAVGAVVILIAIAIALFVLLRDRTNV